MLAAQKTIAPPSSTAAAAETVTTTIIAKSNNILNESNRGLSCNNGIKSLVVEEQQHQEQKDKQKQKQNLLFPCNNNNNNNKDCSSSSNGSNSNSPPPTSIKLKRRDSTTSDSSLEHLDLGRTPKKLKLNCISSTSTSTPFVTTNNNAKKGEKRHLQRLQESDHVDDFDEYEEEDDEAEAEEREASLSDEKNINVRMMTEMHQIDETQKEEFQKLSHPHSTTNNIRPSATRSKNNQHFKRRNISGRSSLDKRRTATTCIQLECNSDSPDSLRKKFRFNHYRHNSSDNILASSNESGFVDGNNSSLLINNLTSITLSNSQLYNHHKSNTTSSSSSTPTHQNGIAQNSNVDCISNLESGVGGGERDDMKYVCPICEVVSATPHEFTNHIRCHNYASGDTENFTCRICSKVLSSASSLDRHVLVHTGERPFNCKYCHLTFTTNGNMHRHMRTHKQHPHTHHRRNSNGSTKSNNHYNNSNNHKTGTAYLGSSSSGDSGITASTTATNSKINTSVTVTTALNTIAQNMNITNGDVITTTATGNPPTNGLMLLTEAPLNRQLNYNEVNLGSTMIYNNCMNINRVSGDHALNPNAEITIAGDNIDVNGHTGHGQHLNGDGVGDSGITNMDNSEESDEECSSDNSTANSQMSKNYNNNNNNNTNNNNNNDNNNNNNKLNSNNNFEWTLLEENHEDCKQNNLTDVTFPINEERTKQSSPNIQINNNDLQQHIVVPLINGNSIIISNYNSNSPKDSCGYGFVCPVCNENDFSNMLALDNHMDAQHPNIPAKCKYCDVIFRTHHQLNQHPCTAELKHNLDYMQQINMAKNFSLKEQYSSSSAFASFKDNNNGLIKPNKMAENNSINENDGDVEVTTKQKLAHRNEFLQQHYVNNISAASATELTNPLAEIMTKPAFPTVIHQYEREDEQECQVQPSQNVDSKDDDIKSEPSAQDPKDLADIQSILNMTSSSSTSNFLKNFEHNVNTPSSQCSYDKDEEEAQDAFTSEFRKMKLRGEFPCKLCTAVFPNLRALKGHNRVHLSECGTSGPFRCNMCPYSNCDKAALVRHMRTHNGDRPYECAVCNYAFTTKANCERHLRNRHAKTTREEVKRAIIYHPSEDSSCDDPTKKIHMFSSPECDDDSDLIMCQASQPNDRSTPISHLKEMLTSGESPLTKPVKIQVKSLEQLLDKSPSTSSAFQRRYEEEWKLNNDIHNNEPKGPIDMSMDVLDLSKKSPLTSTSNHSQNGHDCDQSSQICSNFISKSLQDPKVNCSSHSNESIANLKDPKFDLTILEKQQQLLLAQQQLLVNPTQYLQQLYHHLMLPQLSPFFLPNSFMPNTNISELQKFTPFLRHIFNTPATVINGPHSNDDMDNSTSLPSLVNATSNANVSSGTINPILPQMPNPVMCSEKSNSSSLNSSLPSPKDIISSNITVPINMTMQSLPPPSSHLSSNTNVPIKMVLKNGVFMPKQKQRRYRTERPFACEHCSARFTLRSNMERHVKQQHPQYYAQRQRTGHHVMRGRSTSSSTIPTVHLNSATHLQAFSHANGSTTGLNALSPISDQVKYAILAQQLKARKDTDLLHQALSHGSNNINIFRGTPASSNAIGGPSFSFTTSNTSNTPNGSMEDDDDKLIIDEDEEQEEKILKDNADAVVITNEKTENGKYEHSKSESEVTPTTKDGTSNKKSKKELGSSVEAKSILEQVIKSGSNCTSLAKPENGLKVISNTPNTIHTLIAQAPAVGKFLKEVASSSFKDESQDLVSVSKLVDNATSNSVLFNNYFRPADLTNHNEHSDEEGLVASGSASESNNSGAEDCTAVPTVQPKKKSAYSLAPNRVSCPYCQRMFPWSSSLRRHILTHTGQKPFKCSHCPLLFTTKSNCDRHLLRKHGNIESATSVYVPTEDVSEPIPPPKSVEEIQKMQRQREEEERERKRKAEKSRREQQQEKEREKQQQQQQQQIHQEQSHQNQREFFQQLSTTQMQQHYHNHKSESGQQISSTDLPFKCHLCESSFAERLLCLDHIKVLHTQEFTLLLSKGAIDNDAETSHATSNEEDERMGSKGSAGGVCNVNNHDDGIKLGKYPDYSNRKVICAFCMRRFWSTEDLRRHMRTHSGERPFQCEICLRKFTLKHSMLRHMKKHNELNAIDGEGEVEVEGDADGDGDNDYQAARDFSMINNNNSASDYSDDEQQQQNQRQQAAMQSIASATVVAATVESRPSINTNNPLMTSSFIGKKIHELLTKANEWRTGNLNGDTSLIVHNRDCSKLDTIEDINNIQQSHSDLIGNLLGISDQSMLNKLMSSPDEAAKLLGIDK